LLSNLFQGKLLPTKLLRAAREGGKGDNVGQRPEIFAGCMWLLAAAFQQVRHHEGIALL
jgi:hypothetical protein